MRRFLSLSWLYAKCEAILVGLAQSLDTCWKVSLALAKGDSPKSISIMNMLVFCLFNHDYIGHFVNTVHIFTSKAFEFLLPFWFETPFLFFVFFFTIISSCVSWMAGAWCSSVDALKYLLLLPMPILHKTSPAWPKPFQCPGRNTELFLLALCWSHDHTMKRTPFFSFFDSWYFFLAANYTWKLNAYSSLVQADSIICAVFTCGETSQVYRP